MYGKAIQYLTIWGGLGVALLIFAKPSNEELNKIKDFSAKTQGFSDVIKAASDPNSKPIYLMKPGEQFLPKKTSSESSSSTK